MKLVEERNALDGDGMGPWHMKLNYQRFDDPAGTPVSGTLEQWWADRDDWRLQVTEGTSTWTRVHTAADGLSLSNTPVNANIRLLLEYIIHPVESENLSAVEPTPYPHGFGSLKATCLMMQPRQQFQPPLPQREFMVPPLGLFATYCVNDDNDIVISHPTAGLTLGTTRLGKFRQRNVPMQAFLSDGKTKLLEMQLTGLNAIEAGEVDLSTTGLTSHKSDIARISGGVMAGQILSKVPPFYPEGAKRRHVSGTIVLRGLIGADGRVHRLEVMGSPDFDLMVSAVNAVSQWRYRPFVLNGEPTDVDTKITVNFNLN